MFGLPGLAIKIESPASDAARRIIERSEADLEPGERSRQPSSDLAQPNAEFLVARLDGRPVGCIALLDHVRYGEVRRLFVAEEARGNGIAAALVAALEVAARDIGLTRVGIAEPGGARRTFSRAGFRASGREADLWLEKTL